MKKFLTAILALVLALSMLCGACLVSLEYFPRIFEDDFKMEIAHNGSNHIFYSAKGWIYHNDELICSNGYHYVEKESTFGKMLEIIKKTLI